VTILWILGRTVGNALPDLMWIRIVTGCCEWCNEILGAIKCGEFVDWVMK